jgi:hypothetical protein
MELCAGTHDTKSTYERYREWPLLVLTLELPGAAGGDCFIGALPLGKVTSLLLSRQSVTCDAK